MISAVWIIRQIVIFEAVDPVIVVEINTKEVFRTVDVIPKKRLFVVGYAIAQRNIVVLIKVRNEVVIFIPARENDGVGPPCPQRLQSGVRS